MKVSIQIEFIVPDAPDEEAAKAAASLAAYYYLGFVEVSNYGSDIEFVTVLVDGYGELDVMIGDNHE